MQWYCCKYFALPVGISIEHTYRNAEYKPNTVQRYIKTGYYANICTTILIHLQLFNRQHLFSNYYSLTRA